MKNIYLKFWCLGLFLVALPTGAVSGDESVVAKSSPALKLIEIDFYDATERFQVKYGLPDRFIIKKAEIDNRAAAADSLAFYSIEAVFTQPGLYTFIFENSDDSFFVFETRKIRVLVNEKRPDIDEGNQKVVVSPEDSIWKTYRRGKTNARVGNQILINWSYYPGGEGIPGGWKLPRIENFPYPY